MENKLSIKALIRLAIFTLIFYLLIRVCSLVSLIPGVYPFTAALTLLPCGIVWMYLRIKVPVRFSILIQATLLTILTFIGGTPYFIAIGMLVGGTVAEFITFQKEKEPSHRNILFGYIVFGLIYHTSVYLIMIIARDYYISYIESLGMPMDFVMKMLNMVSWGTFVLGAFASVVCAFIGTHIGKKIALRFFK